MKELEKITIVFENLESADFVPEDFGIFYLRNLQTSICRVAVNAIIKQVVCEEVVLELLPTANRPVNGFMADLEDMAINVFDRIKYQDITYFELTYSDGTQSEVFVPWGEEDDCTNDLQISREIHGKMYVIINKNSRIPESLAPILNDQE